MNVRVLSLGLALTCSLAAAQGLKPATRLGVSPAASTGAPAPTRQAPSAPAVAASIRPGDYIVAIVNSEPITNNEVFARLLRAEAQMAQQGQTLPKRAELRDQVLERMINERAQLQVAKENGLRIDESTLDSAETNLANQNQVSVEELRRRLGGDGLTVAQFRDDLRNQLTLQRLRDREVDSRVRVSDTDIDQYLRENDTVIDPNLQEVNLAHILISLPEKATPVEVAARRQRAEEVLAKARAGENFTALVNTYSDGDKRNDGKIGLKPISRYPSLFSDATKHLPLDGISDILRSDAGFHILKVAAKHREGMGAPKVVQLRARHILLRPTAQMSEADAVRRLADFRRRILAGQADFANLAREYSQDGSAKQGGDLGWTMAGQFVPEFETPLNALAAGDISAPVISRFGVHLIQLMERREVALSERDQREMARNQLRERKSDEAYADWAKDVRGRAYVEMREPPQ